MYQEVEQTVNGFLRGTKGFDAHGFASLSPQEQYRVCNIPLSQPLFTGAPRFKCMNRLLKSWNVNESYIR